MSRKLLAAAGSISASTLLSRILGLIRDSLMAGVFGAGWVAGTFLIAWMLPNLMRRLLGEGALSASFVPAYARVLKGQGGAAAAQLLGQVTGTVVAVLVPFTLLVVGLCLLLPPDWLPAGDAGVRGNALLLELNAWLFPYAVPVCLTAIYSGALNTLGSFGLPASVPTVLNLFWIAGLVLAEPFGIGTAAATLDERHLAVARFVALFLLVGGFAQLLIVIWPLQRRGAMAPPVLGWPPAGSPGRAVFVAMTPTVLGMSLNQLSALLDQAMAYYLVAPGANTYVYLANRLLLFPHALTALAVAVAVFPSLASEAIEPDRSGLRRTLDAAASAMLLVTLPAAAGLVVLADDIAVALFRYREFTAADARATAATTACLVAGLPFIGLTQLYARVFYALGLPKVPARIAMLLVGANFALGLILVLATDLGTAGLAIATSASAAANALLLQWLLREQAPGGGIGAAWLRSSVATAAMCAAIVLLRPEVQGDERFDVVVWRVAVPIALGVVVYFAVHALLRSPELQLLRRRRG